MTLTTSDYETLSAVIGRLYELQDLDGYIMTAMRELPGLVDADLAGYNEVDYAERRMMTVVSASEAQRYYHQQQLLFEAHMHQQPLIANSATERGNAIRISDFLSLDEWRGTGIYHQYYRGLRANHQIAVALALETDTIVAFAFNREVSDFTERHRAILNHLQPHLTRAYQNALKHTRQTSRLKRREEMLDQLGAGWIDLDPELKVANATHSALDHISAFFSAELGEGSSLPGDVEQWIRANLETAREGAPFPPLVTYGPSGRLILRLICNAAGGEVSLLAERFIEDAEPEALRGLGLTERQAEVLYWLAQGKSNAEISIILSISQRTVEAHVAAILSALDVSNRTEAAKTAAAHLTAMKG